MRLTSVLAAGAVLATFACSGSPSGPSDASASGPSGSMGTMNVRLTDSPLRERESRIRHLLRGVGTARRRWLDETAVRRWLHHADVRPEETAELRAGRAGDGTADPRAVQLDTPADPEREDLSGCTVHVAHAVRRIDGRAAGRCVGVHDSVGRSEAEWTFTLTAGAATTLLLDFDGESSIEKTGNGYLDETGRSGSSASSSLRRS